MIYNFPAPDEPLRQGDIFRSVPFVYFNPAVMPVVRDLDKMEIVSSNWSEESSKSAVQAILEIRPVYGIIASQDCDTAHQENIALFLVDQCARVLGKTPPVSPPATEAKVKKWWIDRITEDTRSEQRWFYLPPDERLGFSERMAANFRVVIPVLSDYLKDNRALMRIGRLNDEADEHFREQIAQFFRRYPYDEWYALSKDEFSVYVGEKSRQDTPPRPWQE